MGSVCQAVATREGLAGWWTRDVEGDVHVGGTLRFFFGGPDPECVMEVTALTPSYCVDWRFVEGPEEWVDTTLRFDLVTLDCETVLMCMYADWREPIAFMWYCSTKWAYRLLGLKAWLEGGKANAYPDDMPISNWG